MDEHRKSSDRRQNLRRDIDRRNEKVNVDNERRYSQERRFSNERRKLNRRES